MRNSLALISFLLIVLPTIPYLRDILKGRVRPARSTRIMMLLLITVTLLQQQGLGGGLALTVTVAEVVSAAMLFLAGIKHGVGGLQRLDLICYGLLFLDLVIWLTTRNTLLALHLSIVADTVAFWPTLYKTWHDHKSETVIFYWAGSIAPLFSIAAERNWSYQTLVFPAYLAVVNAIEVGLIYGFHTRKKSIL